MDKPTEITPFIAAALLLRGVDTRGYDISMDARVDRFAGGVVCWLIEGKPACYGQIHMKCVFVIPLEEIVSVRGFPAQDCVYDFLAMRIQMKVDALVKVIETRNRRLLRYSRQVAARANW